MTTAEHVKTVNEVSLSQRPTLPAARDKARASSLWCVQLVSNGDKCEYFILYPAVSNQQLVMGLFLYGLKQPGTGI